jgi:S1-C subfamily serine protease
VVGGTAPNYDLAVVRLRTSNTVPRPVAIGSSADLKVGQFAFAIGNPFGLDIEDRRAHSRESCMLQGRRILAGIS